MRVLVVTKIFPNALEPLSAPFNRQQIAALRRRRQVEVLADDPLVSRRGRVRALVADGPAARRARAPTASTASTSSTRARSTSPAIGHALSAALYAASVLPAMLAPARALRRAARLAGRTRTGSPRSRSAERCGVPTVVKLHGSDIDVLAQRPALRRQLALALPRAARVVAVSRALAEAAEESGRARQTASMSSANGVDSALFHPRDRAAARARSSAAAATPASGFSPSGASRPRRARSISRPPSGASRPPTPTRRWSWSATARARAEVEAAARPARRSGDLHRAATTGRSAGLDGRVRRPDATQPPRRDAQRAARGAGVRPARGRHPRRRDPRRRVTATSSASWCRSATSRRWQRRWRAWPGHRTTRARSPRWARAAAGTRAPPSWPRRRARSGTRPRDTSARRRARGATAGAPA